jgi:hypothetical protein
MTPKDCWSPRSVGVHFVEQEVADATSPKNTIVSRRARSDQTCVTEDRARRERPP